MAGKRNIIELNQVLTLRKEKAVPHESDIRSYVALEHMISGQTRIQSMGLANDATSTKSTFQNNDILFGRLRPYLRKCALAETSGLCVTDILVLTPKSHSAAYLCQLLHSDRVMGYAIRSSIGTKMPRVGWDSLGEFPVSIHSQNQQKRIATLLDSIDTVIEKTTNLTSQIESSRGALMQSLLFAGTKKSHQVRLGQLFDERKESGKSTVPILSVTMNQGLVRRDELGRKVESELTPGQHLFVLKGDIAYNMMRMWQGVSGLAECDGVVSPAYVVLKPTKLIDSRYASYLFKLPEIIRLFHRFSQGLTNDRLRLYYDQFRDIKATVPVSVKEQTKIATLLTAYDNRINSLKTRSAQLTRLKTALSQKIFN